MYRVLMVDDEPWTLLGMEKTFRWQQLGFQLIGGTTDSLEAMDRIVKERPDVVISDIRMPRLTGLDLLRKTRELGIDSEFIMISGYAEFTYVQAALRYGGYDYLLKPLQTDDANSLLARLHAHLEGKLLHKEMDTVSKLTSSSASALIADYLNKLNKPTDIDSLQVMISEYSPESAKSAERIMHKLQAWESVVFRLGLCKNLHIFLNPKADAGDAITEYYKEAGAGAQISFGISGVSRDAKEIKKLLKAADIVLCNTFVYQGCGVFRHTDRNSKVLDIALNQICDAIHSKDLTSLEAIMADLPGVFTANNMGMRDVDYWWNKLTAYLVGHTGIQASKDEFEFMDYKEITMAFHDFPALCNYIVEVVSSLIRTHTPMVEADCNDQFREMLDYIQENYNQKLQLTELSKMFYLNLTYCCELFRKTTGATFTEYMIDLRMNKARELMKNKLLSLIEISQEVGYSDYYYFNKVFKKHYGVTPTKYRNL